MRDIRLGTHRVASLYLSADQLRQMATETQADRRRSAIILFGLELI